MSRSSYRHVILSAIAVYTFLALGTDIFDQKEPKKDVFKLEKLVSVFCVTFDVTSTAMVLLVFFGVLVMFFV